jgi:hypothetical protein
MSASCFQSPQATAATLAIIETFAKLRELSKNIAKLAETTEKPLQQSLLQRSGEIFSDLLAANMPVSETETTIELNLAVMKLRHTVKKEASAKSPSAQKPSRGK